MHNGMELGPDVPREWDQDGNLLGEVEPIEEVIDGNKILCKRKNNIYL